jgi:hypothetical protein
VYVDRAIRHLLEAKLATSPTFGTKEMINIMMEEFEKKVCPEICHVATSCSDTGSWESRTRDYSEAICHPIQYILEEITIMTEHIVF